MCKGGSKTTNTESETDTSQAGGTSTSGGTSSEGTSTSSQSGDSTSTYTGDSTTYAAAIKALEAAIDLSGSYTGLSDEQKETISGLQSLIGKSGSWADQLIPKAVDYADKSTKQITLKDLEIDKYLNPYADYVMQGLNDGIGSENKKRQGIASTTMGGVGGDRAAVAEAEKLRLDQIARGQTMAGIYDKATTTAMGQQAANYTVDSGNRDAYLKAAAGLGSLGVAEQQALMSGLSGLWTAGTASQLAPFLGNQYLSSIISTLSPTTGGTTTTSADTTTDTSASTDTTNWSDILSWLTGESSSSGTSTTSTQQSALSTLLGLGTLATGLFSGGTSSLFSSLFSAGSGGEGSARGGRITRAAGGRVSPYDVGHNYDAGGLVFDPYLDDTLYDTKPTKEMIFDANPFMADEIKEKTYPEKVKDGEATDYREQLWNRGREMMKEPGRENFANRLAAENPPEPMIPSNPFAPASAGVVSPDENPIAAINKAVSLSPGPGLPASAMALDKTETPTATRQNPYKTTSSDPEEEASRVLLEQLRKERPQVDVPKIRYRQPEERSWWGPDGRLTEFGLRLLMATGDRDSNGIPVGPAANLGKAGVGVMDNERKIREDQRKEQELALEARIKNFDQNLKAMKLQDDHDNKRLGAASKIIDTSENRKQRELSRQGLEEHRREQRDIARERLDALKAAREERARIERERLDIQKTRVEIAKSRLDRGDAVWMGNDQNGNAIMYDRKLRDENGNPTTYRVPVGEVLPKPRAKPTSQPTPVEVQQEARRLAEMDARYRDIKPADLTKHIQEVLPKYMDMVKTMWGLQGGPAPGPDNRPSATPSMKPGQDPALATEVARLKNLGKKWSEIEQVLKGYGVADPSIYMD